MASYTGKIYLITNNINGKIYIGQTTSYRDSYMGSGIFIKKAIKKYGKHNFSKIILVDNIELPKQLDCLEFFYIKLYNSRNSKIGYNIREGGNNSSFNHTKESKQKIQSRSLQEDNKIRIREIQKLGCAKNRGSHLSKERKVRMMLTKLGRERFIEIYKNNVLIKICNFSSDASEFTGANKKGIRNNLCGLAKSAGGFVFKYKITD